MIYSLFFIFEAVLLLGFLWVLPFKSGQLIIRGYALGLIVSSIWFFGLQFAPQLTDMPPDAEIYQKQSEAIAKHWLGEPVLSEEYALKGLLARKIKVWEPDSTLNSLSVLGSRHIWYPFFLATGDYFAFDNISKAALNIPFMAACFPMLLLLAQLFLPNKSNFLMWLPCLFLSMSSGFFALGSILLRDVIISCTILNLFLWVAAYWKYSNKVFLFGITIVVFWLTGLRYHFALLFLIALGGVLIVLFMLPNKKDPLSKKAVLYLQKKIVWIGAAVLLGMLLADVFMQGVGAFFNIFGHAYSDTQSILVSNSMDVNSVNSVNSAGIIVGIIHSFFAPYPWVIIYPGLTWQSFYELFFIGSFVFILCLPFLFKGFLKIMKTQSMLQLTFILFILLVASAYFMMLGEFSTRQRESLVPFLWVVVTVGIKSFIDSRKLDGSSKNKSEQ